MKSRNYALLAIVLIIAVIAVGANSNPVAADLCLAQLNYPIMPTAYSYSNVPIVVPTSATCSTYYGSQLYATGNAYDTTSGAGLGSVSTVLQSTDGGTTFNGQLSFNLPPSTQGHTVQISVSIYNGQYGNQITATSETIQVGTGNQLQYQQVTTTTVTQVYTDPYQNMYLPQNQSPYPYPAPTYGPSSQQPSPQYRNQSQYPTLYYHYWNRSSLLDYVAIVAILAAVIIATAGLVVYGRRRQPTPVTWIPPPPPPR
jgi:hypothetical protein